MLEEAISGFKVLRNALGVRQDLFNFNEGSTERHGMFQELINLAGDKSLITLKPISATRWTMGCC